MKQGAPEVNTFSYKLCSPSTPRVPQIRASLPANFQDFLSTQNPQLFSWFCCVVCYRGKRLSWFRRQMVFLIHVKIFPNYLNFITSKTVSLDNSRETLYSWTFTYIVLPLQNCEKARNYLPLPQGINLSYRKSLPQSRYLGHSILVRLLHAFFNSFHINRKLKCWWGRMCNSNFYANHCIISLKLSC